MTQTTDQKYVLQLCHGYQMPFLDVARQYASLFDATEYKVITVYLTGQKDQHVIDNSASDKVIFLEYDSKDIRGLKLKQIKQIKQLHQQYNFKLAIAHRYKAIYILQFIKGLPVIGINHAFNVYQNRTRRWFTTLNHKNLYLLGVSNAIRDNIKQQLPSFPQQHIQTLYNRINSDEISHSQFNTAEARKALDLTSDRFVFANVGRLHPDKDQKTLIDSFSLISDDIPNSILVIIGKGKLESELKQQIQSLDLDNRVFLLGIVPEAVKYFKAFDCFVLSSDYEPFGMVLLEAILADIPIIATNAGGAKEILADKDYLVNVGDSQRMAELMLKVYHLDTQEKENSCNKNAKRLNNFFTDKAAREAFWKLDFVQDIIQNKCD